MFAPTFDNTASSATHHQRYIVATTFMPSTGTNSAFSWAGSICSILGLAAVIFLQVQQFDDWTLLFWWLATAMIGIAGLSATFAARSISLRLIFAAIFIVQMPAFVWSWATYYEQVSSLRLLASEDDEQGQKIDRLEMENKDLRSQQRRSLLFWESMAHLTGMWFALVACTAAGQSGLRITYDDT